MNIAVKIPAADAAAEIAATPLEKLNPAKVSRFYDDTIWPVFERLRREDPVHFTPESEYGPYWSITKWNDIMAVDTNHQDFSSVDGITLINQQMMAEQEKVMGARRRGGAGFITMDEPEHGPARKAVSPTVAPGNLHAMAPLVRERCGQILDSLPIGKEFDWVDLVSKELTAMTLATLFDFPFEQRRKLTWWSDMVTNQPGHGPVESWEQKGAAMFECFAAFTELWNQRVDAEPRNDLISMLAHNPATRNMPLETFQGNVILLIVGGNDTTRNTISSSVYSLNKNPEQYAKLRANHDLVLPMVSETIRWQTPLAHMARVATRDVELGGKTIKKGERVHHRSRAAAPAHVVRLWRSPLRGQPRRRNAADHHLGRDPQALPGDQGGRRADAELVGLCARVREPAGDHPHPQLMHTDPADAEAIEKSLEIAAERGGDLTPVVYGRLFERQPDMQALFWRDTTHAVKGEMLMRVFEGILDFIRARQFADHLISTEVVTHAGYDVPPDVFATFFGLVAEVIEEACGPDWTPAMAGAWRRTLADLDVFVIHPSRATA